MCEGRRPAGRLEPGSREAVDLGRAPATGRVFPLYTCQKKPVIQWMALSDYPEGFTVLTYPDSYLLPSFHTASEAGWKPRGGVHRSAFSRM